MTPAEREAIRQKLEAGEYASAYCEADEAIEQLLAEVARLQGLLDRTVEKLLEAPRQKAYLDKAYAFDVVHAAAIDEVLELVCGAIPPSPQEPDK